MPGPTPLDPMLLSILVCPADRGRLLAVDDVLYNPRLRRAYRIEDGIPVLLVDEAADVGQTEHERLMAQAGAGPDAV
jgi:uncharacterized protein YbaR (Trm112 family)